ncbi:hypothetical protein VB713_05895 [Anabaena cylindrica UHCC 0172]|uniref:hypothetical protein n=1 Tax=Anabaena cylindrica TaxID=1165 RepID=UPI002B20B227|nr:hypothetical protein [Anabaena cylindrica]MEA5550514.1 hypothetical protein [Anabaena cylindrica UHCC 0172]
MRTTTGHVHRQPPTPSYSPSVPLHVYRELATELQAIQSKLDVVTTHNQKLSQENQLLRQEITKVIQAFNHLQNLVESSNIPIAEPKPRINTELKQVSQPPVTAAPPRQQASRPRPPAVTKVPPSKSRREEFSVPIMDMNFPVSETVFVEEQEVHYYPTPESELKGLNGWWLIMTIVLMMITGFGAGYLIVRPLLQNQNNS